MKKILLLALAVAVVFCLPLTAAAKADFELGGYIRLDAMWNSKSAVSHSLASLVVRNNVLNGSHGRFLMNANATRFNFTIKGPQVWGGKVTGFIEADFDGQDTRTGNTIDSSFNQAKLRLRHAMFKIVWPDREVLFGQYWSINSEFIPDTADSGGYCLYGATQLRLPQVRYTQKFMDGVDASLAICSPQNGRWGLNIDNADLTGTEGELSETPMVEGKFRFEQDFYGKAAWGGKPRGFYVGLGAGYFRSRNAVNNALAAAGAWNTFGKNTWGNPAWILNVNNMRNHDHWLFLIENFTPIIPTVSKSVAGTLGLSHQW